MRYVIYELENELVAHPIPMKSHATEQMAGNHLNKYGRGWGYTGDDNRYVYYVKGPILDPNKLKAIYTLPFRLTKDTNLCMFK